MLMPNTYVQYMARAFDDHARLTAATPLETVDLAELDVPVAVGHVLQVLRNAMTMAQSADWYLDWAKGMAEHYHGPVTMAAVSAPTLGDGLDAFVRYMPVRVPYHRWSSFTRDDAFFCELTELIDFGPCRPAVIEIPLLALHEYVGRLRRRDTKGQRIELRYPPTAHHELYARWFDCPVLFDAPHNALAIPREWRDITNPGFDEGNWQAALRRCEQTSPGLQDKQTADNVHDEVLLFLDNTDGGSPPTLDVIAARMHASPRTLIRRLRNAGTNYQEIIDEIQKERARRLLLNSDIRIYEVGNELGFQDPASFGRSFKRWFGKTPGSYRKEFRRGEK